jgi:hypothetical protein
MIKRNEIKIILKHKSNFLFVARIIKSSNAFKVLGVENDRELNRLYQSNKELLSCVKKCFLKPSSLGKGPSELVTWGPQEVRALPKYKKIKGNDNLIIIDNAILKAKSDEDINFDLLIADYQKGNSIDFKHIKNCPIVQLINMSGCFLIIAFWKPGIAKRILKKLHLK